MSATSNIHLVQDWVEQVWNAGDLEALATFHPPVFQNEGKSSSIADAQAWHKRMRATYPDIQYVIQDIFATAEQVAMRWTATGTHQGTLWGIILPTGKQITWHGMHMVRIENDQIVDIWAVGDTSTQLQQMGVRLQPPAIP